MSFDSDLQAFIKKTNIGVDIAIRKIVFDAHKMLTHKTPVDTGRAKGNWNVSVGSIDRSVDLNKKGYKSPTQRKGDGLKTNYIVNSLPYIRRLEYGHSKKAPNGMVRVTVNELRSYFK